MVLVTFPKAIGKGKQGRHIQGFHIVTNECGKDSRRWNHISVHKRWCHGIQRRRCAHHMQRRAHTHRRERYEWQIPHTISTATRAMATEATDQTTTKVPSASQQRVRSTINRAGNQWMHAVCGYPVKSTWLKAVKAGNYVGWPVYFVPYIHHRYYPTRGLCRPRRRTLGGKEWKISADNSRQPHPTTGRGVGGG